MVTIAIDHTPVKFKTKRVVACATTLFTAYGWNRFFPKDNLK